MFKLAWRNLWRNRGRTTITLSSIILAVFLSVFMRSLQEGTYKTGLRGFIEGSVGVFQIQHKDYIEDPLLDHSFDPTLLPSMGHIGELHFQISSVALAHHKKNTQGVFIRGIDFKNENQLFMKSNNLNKFHNIEVDNNEVIVSSGLAKRLKLNINDTLFLMGQGFRGQSALDNFLVKGIIKTTNPALNQNLLYVSIKGAQNFYQLENRITQVRLNPNQNFSKLPLQESKILDKYDLVLSSWKDILKTLLQQINTDRAAGKLMQILLYTIVGFVIFGTCQMLLSERKKEFAILIALGMTKKKLLHLLILEIATLLIMGLLLGIILTIPVVYYFQVNPIPLWGDIASAMEKFGLPPYLPLLFSVKIFINQVAIVFCMSLILFILPHRFLKSFNLAQRLNGDS